MLTLTDANGSKLFPILWHRYDSTREGRSIVHEYASGQLAITTRPAKNRRVRVRLLFNDETAAYVAELMHAHAVGPLTISDPEVPSVGMSYAVVEGSQVRREQVEGHPGIWFVEVDALDTQSPTVAEAAPFVHTNSNWATLNPGMRTSAHNTDHWRAEPGTLTRQFGVDAPAFVSGLACEYDVAPMGTAMSLGPRPMMLNACYTDYPDRDITIVWRLQNAPSATAPILVSTNATGLQGEVRDVSPPVTLAPGDATQQWATIRPSGLQGETSNDGSIRSRIGAVAGRVLIGDYNVYPAHYLPERDWFDGSLPATDALTRHSWTGSPNNSRSSRAYRRLVVPA